MLYYVALQGGLRIRERHPHTVDLYSDAERYAPLGSDASVAFGFKDLRFENSLKTPIYFVVFVREEAISCRLHAPRAIPSSRTTFRELAPDQGFRIVETRRHYPNGEEENLGISTYRRGAQPAGVDPDNGSNAETLSSP